MELRKHGAPIRLQEQPFRVLAMLAERPGEVITREELRERIWGKKAHLEPAINFRACGAGSQFLAIREAKSAAYPAYVLGASRAHLIKPSDFARDKRQSGPWTSAALRPTVAASW
jgi:hypothetical protein